MTPARQLARCERGTAAIEFAFIAMLLILGTVGTIEVGRALFLMNELAHAADRAARVVMLDFYIEESDLTEAVQDEDRLTGLVPADVTVVSAAPGTGDTFRSVRLTYAFTPMISGFTIASVPLTAERSVAR